MSVLPTRDVWCELRGMDASSAGNTERQTVLWVSSHPELRSLNGHLQAAGITHLRALGHRVLVSDLYALDWDPVLRREDGVHSATTLDQRFRVSEDTRTAHREGTQPADVARERAKLVAADAVVVQFPLWWYGMPAILKGWFDRVLVSGFAFGIDPDSGQRLRFEQGPFVGKRALVVTTLGDRAKAIGPRGISGQLDQLLFGLLHGTLAYTGMSVLHPWALPSADHLDETRDPGSSLLERLDSLFTEAPIEYRHQFAGDYTEEWELHHDVCPNETGLNVHIRREATPGRE